MMSLVSRTRTWWRALVHRSQTDRAIEEELRFDIDCYAEELMRSGMPARQAHRQAKIDFGRADVQKELYREAIGLRPLDEICSDLRYGIRSLFHHPSVSIAAILSLALGIGATSAMFNVIYSAVLNPFPYHDADRIVNPSLIDEKQPLLPTWFPLEPAQYERFHQAKSTDSVLGFLIRSQPDTGSELPQDVVIAYVTPNMNDFLGVSPIIGRGFQLSDKSQNVVLLDYKYWQKQYGGDSSVVGKTLELDHQPLTILGVMPARFAFTETVGNVDCYVPANVTVAPALLPWIKLKPGVTPAAADAEFQSYLEQFQVETPKRFPKKFRVDVQPIAVPYLHRTGKTLALLFVSTLFLLLIGCANCSVLLLARGEARQQELAVRSAIGAGRYRLIRQLLVESFTIAVMGAILGTVLSYWLAQLPLKLMPSIFPQEAHITMNWPVLAFSIALALLTGVLFGLAPALRFSRPEISQMMQSRGRRVSTAGSRSLNLLIGSQVALTLILLGIAGAAVAGFKHLTSLNLGYDPHNVGFIGLPLKRDPTKNHQAYASYIAQLRDAVAAVPGVFSAGVTSSYIPPIQPFGGLGLPAAFEILGEKPTQTPRALVQMVSPDFFATLKTPLVRGRLWTDDENRRGDFVAVVNETFAQQYFADRNAIGQQVRTDALKNDNAPALITSPQSDQWRTILGVVADSRNNGLERPVAAAIYVPYTAFMWNETRIFFRATNDPKTMEHAIRQGLHRLNSEQRISWNTIGTLEGALSGQPLWVQQHMLSVLFSFFGALALALSLFGIASTVLFAAGRRKNELGIRSALGATRTHIVWIVSRTTIITVVCGIGVGFLFSTGLRRLLALWMPANNNSPWIVAPATALLLTASAVACLLPALKAARANPLETLREE
jgi:predicted permease